MRSMTCFCQKLLCIFLILFIAAIAAPPGPGKEYTYSCGSGIKMWIPDGLTTVKGILLVALHQGGSHIYNDYSKRDWDKDKVDGSQLGYEKFLKEGSFVMIGYPNDCGGWQSTACEGFDRVGKAIDDFASQSSHPELKTAPIATIGLSRGAECAQKMAADIGPERTLGALPLAHCKDQGLAALVPSLYNIHKILFDDLRCDYQNALKSMLWHNSQGGYAAVLPVAFAAHHEVGGQSYNIFWLKELIKLRIPGDPSQKLKTLVREDGWIGTADISNNKASNAKVMPWADYTGDKNKVSWFPNEVTARAWVYYCENVTLNGFDANAVNASRPSAKSPFAAQSGGLCSAALFSINGRSIPKSVGKLNVQSNGAAVCIIRYSNNGQSHSRRALISDFGRK